MKKKLLILLLCVPFFYGCPNRENDIYLRILNMSNQDIYVYMSVHQNDTLSLDNRGLNLYYTRSSKRESGGTYLIFPEINDSTYLTILSADTVNKYPWDVIVKDMKILKRYAISNKESDLKAINYTVYYSE